MYKCSDFLKKTVTDSFKCLLQQKCEPRKCGISYNGVSKGRSQSGSFLDHLVGG